MRFVFAAYVGINLGEPQSWHLGVGEAQSNAARNEITILSAPASLPGSERKALSWR